MFPSRNLLTRIYTAKKPWPPDFSLLTKQHQFRLERRYRRRCQLKYARPRLQKIVTLTQWSSAIFVIWYGVFWADWGTEDTPFQPIRNWVKEKREGFWSTSGNNLPRGTGEVKN